MDGLTAAMPQRLLMEWAAFDRLEPFGPRAEEWRAGVLAQVIAASGRAYVSLKPGEAFGSLADKGEGR